jgi:hypothetical protein
MYPFMKQIPLLVCVFLAATNAYAEPVCTTSAKIQFPDTISTAGLTAEQQKQVVYAALYSNMSEPRWDDIEPPKGVWRFVSETDGVIYAKLDKGSWYLQAAISPDAESLSTIVCNSEGLKQTETSIHRNTPKHKARLDSALGGRVEKALEMGMPDSPPEGVEGDLKYLDSLKQSGFVTDDEYANIRQRLLDSI